MKEAYKSRASIDSTKSKLCRAVALSVGIEILHMDSVDFKEDQIYGMDYKKYVMVIKHKKL